MRHFSIYKLFKQQIMINLIMILGSFIGIFMPDRMKNLFKKIDFHRNYKNHAKTHPESVLKTQIVCNAIQVKED
mgnify:CR=1 FL=1